MRVFRQFVFVLSLAALCAASDLHLATGMIVAADAQKRTITISCDEIPGVMDAMVMSFGVRDGKVLSSLRRGDVVQFVIRSEADDTFADEIKVVGYDPAEIDPSQARRMRLMTRGFNQSAMVPVGSVIPNFRLIDQSGAELSMSQLNGKVVVVNFMYTRCALPNYCYRLSNNLGQVQNRFRKRLGKDLVLLTITFDPVHDRPEQLAKYAANWKADPQTWHFLTGTEEEIARVCEMFGVDSFPDEGLFAHSLHTLIIGRSGRLEANLEGNKFSAAQLGDLVEAVLQQKP